MDPSSDPLAPSQRPFSKGPALAAVVAALAAIPALLLRDLWAVDEPRYARIAMEMAERGDFLLPHLHGAVYVDKPPLLFWLANLVATVTTWANGLPIRLVSLAFGVATAALTARLAARFAGGRAGLLAGLALAAMPLQLAVSQAGMFDTLLAFGVTLAWSGLVDRRALLFGVGVGFGVLAKGPMAILLTVPGAAVFAAWGAPRGTRLRALVPGRFAAVAALAALLVAGAWYVPAVIAGGSAYLDETLGRQTIGRAAGGWAHARPFWFYAATLPLAAFPFFLALPAAMKRLGSSDTLHRLALAWLGTGFLLLSLVSGKQIHYLVPILPSLGILAGREIAARDLSPRAFAAAAVLGALAALSLLFGPALLGSFGALEDLGPERRAALGALAPVGAALALAILAILAARGTRLPRATLVFALPLVAALAFPIAAARDWNALGTGRAFGDAIRARVASAEAIALYRVGRNGSLSLYSGLGPIPFFHDFDSFRAAVTAPASRVEFVACRAQDVASVEAHLGTRLEVVAVGWNDWDREALCRVIR